MSGGIASFLLVSGDSLVITVLLAAGFSFLITGIFRHRIYGDDSESDERSRKIGAYGLSYAWLTGLFFMTGLFWLDYLGIGRFSTRTSLGMSVVVLAISAVVFQVILFRKGDVG